MPVFIAHRYMSFTQSADCPFHQKASHQTPQGAKVNYITRFFPYRRLNER
jgi:hypothetical protein